MKHVGQTAAPTDCFQAARGQRREEFVAANRWFFLLSLAPLARWAPFEGGHEIPLPVWRDLRKFLGALLRSSQNGGGSCHPGGNSVTTSADKRMLKR